ncbi:MAG: methyltransferase domain-containing protein, partial [Chitinophagaceae bacterium]
MAWNPAVYNKFKQERATPFFDLLALVKPANNMRVIDLGCGTGELTSILSQNLPGAMVKGIDSSAEMLEKMSNLQHDHLSFELLSIQDQLNKKEKWDLVFSNAALQWVNDHEKLFPQLISQVNAGGQIAVQMPAQSHNLTNILLNELADESPFRESLQEFKRSSPVLNSERYAAILFENGAAEITVLEKIYPLILPDVDSLYS